MTDLGTARAHRRRLRGDGARRGRDGRDGRDQPPGRPRCPPATPVEQVKPETSLSYEGGRAATIATRFHTDFSVFVNDVDDNIAKQSLILPPGAVGHDARRPADHRADRERRRCSCPASREPRAGAHELRRRADLGRRAHVRLAASPRRGRSATVFTYLHAADQATGVPPNIEGGTPAPEGYLKVRYLQPSGRFWVEPYLHAAGAPGSPVDARPRGPPHGRDPIAHEHPQLLQQRRAPRAAGWAPGPDGVGRERATTCCWRPGRRWRRCRRGCSGTRGLGAARTPTVPGYVTVGDPRAR